MKSQQDLYIYDLNNDHADRKEKVYGRNVKRSP